MSTSLARAAPLLASAPAPAAVPYTWKNVAIGGGGFVSGLVFHPQAPGLMYARTDMGGAYRRDAHTGTWQALLDGLAYRDLNLMGVESLAVDPSDPDKVYLACGTYTAPTVPDGAVLRSADRGRSFQRTDLPVKFGGNEEGRGNGERLAVDPNDGRVLWLGTRLSGLWKSSDRAVSFQPVPGLPDQGDARQGVVFVIVDPRSAAPGQPSQTVYVGVSALGRPNLYRSQDGGATWQALPGQPTPYRPHRAVLAADGALVICYGTAPGPGTMRDGAVWKFQTGTDSWTDITPDRPDATRRFGYAGVAVDARHPGHILASSFGRPEGEELFRSTDGGASWQPLVGANAVFDASPTPYVRDTHLHWLFDVVIAPDNPEHALFTTGYGGWETFDLGQASQGRATHWQPLTPGIEETVALALYSPTQGAALVSGLGDYSGFVHFNLDQVPPEGNPQPPFFGNTHDVTGAELKPQVLLRIGHPRSGKNLGYSLDGGRSWAEPASVPDAHAGEGAIAVSADGATWVWTPQGSRPHVSRDHGGHWQPVASLPPDTRVVADRVNPQRFHAMSLFKGKLYSSHDGAQQFTEQALNLPDGPVLPSRLGGHDHTDRGDARGGQDRLYATPGHEGELWLAAFHGLYHAADGRSFRRMPGVDQLHAFGFGRAAPDAAYPALYLVGTVQGQRGIFRSIDTAARWERINDDAHQWGLILQICGDPKTYGQVYVGTHGRGVVYGVPGDIPTTPPERSLPGTSRSSP